MHTLILLTLLAACIWPHAATACSATWVDTVDHGTHGRRIRVGKAELHLPESDRPASELRQWTPRKGELLLAYTVDNRHQPSGSDTLWRIRCADPHLDPVVHISDADFGHGAVSPDGRTFYFSAAEGISSLDLQTKATRRLTTPPALAHCDTNDSPHQVDVIHHLDRDGTLVFDRGGPCGFEGDWESKRLSLRLGGKTPTVLARHPIASIALDGAGKLWLSDGNCEEPSTHGAVWRSDDQGLHWQRIQVPMLTTQPVRQIRSQGNHLALLTSSCGNAAHVDPSWVYTSIDNGLTWSPITPPPGIPAHDNQPDSEQDPLSAISLDATTITLWGQDSQVIGPASWISTDGGRSWKRSKPTAEPKPTRELISGTTRYQATDDGLVIISDGKTTKTFPTTAR